MLKIRFIDEGKVVAEQKSERIEDFENLFNDIKIKYGTKKGK